MDYSIKNTTIEERKELVKKALGISMSGADIPTDDTLKLAKMYIEGKMELKDLQEKVISKYNKNVD
jgi:hypothetical protein